MTEPKSVHHAHQWELMKLTDEFLEHVAQNFLAERRLRHGRGKPLCCHIWAQIEKDRHAMIEAERSQFENSK